MSKPVKWLYGILNVTVFVMLVLEIFNGAWYNVFLCALTMALFTLPFIIGRNMKIHIPSVLEVIVLLFTFASEILGEMQDYYYRFPYWDKVLHVTNGVLCAAIGLALIDILNKSPDFAIQLSPIFVVFFSFCFSMTVGVLWEFFEYFCDIVIHTNMQKDTILPDGTLDIGLIDTMGDLIVNFIGAFTFSVAGYFYVKRGGKGRIIPYLLLTREDGGLVSGVAESESAASGVEGSGSADVGAVGVDAVPAHAAESVVRRVYAGNDAVSNAVGDPGDHHS